MGYMRNSTSQILKNTNKNKSLLLATVSVAALFFGSTLHASANEWIGTVGDNDLYNGANWSDLLPPTIDSIVNNGAPVGTIVVEEGGGFNADIPSYIGVANGSTASVTINVDSSLVLPDENMDLSFSFDTTLSVGASGGQGELTIDLGRPGSVRLGTTNFVIGSGQNSSGVVNFVSTGKDSSLSPEGPFPISTSDNRKSLFYSAGLENIRIGQQGGTGTLNLDGAGFGYGARQEFVVGDGAGSEGTINILAGGKLGDSEHNYDSTSISPTMGRFTVGLMGGTGTVNIDGSAAADRNNAPLAYFGTGIVLGQGAGSAGTMNVISKGKVHSFIGNQYVDAIEFEGLDRNTRDTRVGVDGGSGRIDVSGDDSVWYQSGIMDYPFYANATTVTSDSGAMRIGESGRGELVIADSGVVRIGSATLTGVQDQDLGYYSLQLTNHVSDGTLYLGSELSGRGVLSIGGAEGEAAAAAGRLMAKTIAFGDGTGIILFNHTSASYVFDQFDDQFGTGTAVPTGINITGAGTLDAVAGRTLLINDHLDFTGVLSPSFGILQVNGNMSSGTANILANGTLEGTGNIGATVNAGILAPGQTPDLAQGLLSSIGTLTITGNYTGTGGSVLIDTVLGDDNSQSDLLFIDGSTSGTSNVKVTNVGGIGAKTVEGIKIIEVTGTSDGAFTLQGNYIHQGEQAVVGGAYAYKLYQGGTSTPSDGSWYLRSDLIGSVPDAPLYQAGVPTYEAYPQSLLGLNGLTTLQERVGNRYWNNNGNLVIAQGADLVGSPYAAPEEAGAATQSNGVWARIEGAHNKMEPRFSTSATDYNQNIFKMQAGLDGMLAENESGKLIGGITVHYAHGKTKTKSVYGDGEISTDGYGLGGSLTWYGENGFYLDGQGQATWYRSDLSSILAQTGLTDGNHGFGYALSLETGKRIALASAWSLTPQAQLVYSNVTFNDFTDAFDAAVSLNRGRSLDGRLGLTLDYESAWQNSKGLTDRSHVYGIANLNYEFLNGTQVSVADLNFSSKNERLWGGVGLGGSYNWDNDKYSIYGEGLINTSLSSFGDSHTLKGQVGFRAKW